MRETRDTFIEAQKRLLDRYEVDATSQFVPVSSIDGEAHVLVAGTGPSVVMISGLGMPGAMWAPLVAKLGGFKKMIVDLPGFGLTPPKPSLTDDFRQRAVQFLEEVLVGLELDRPPLIANSMGSLWTSWFALDRPESVAALVHIGCPALALGTSAPLEMRLLSVPLLGRVMLWLQPASEKQVEELARMANEHPLVPEVADLILATERLPGYRETFLSTLQTLLRVGQPRPELMLTEERLGAIRHPTELVWGRNDPFGGPEVGEKIVEIMPNAELEVVEGGHMPWLDQSTSIGASTTDFLRDLAVAK